MKEVKYQAGYADSGHDMVVDASDYDALLAERDELFEALAGVYFIAGAFSERPEWMRAYEVLAKSGGDV